MGAFPYKNCDIENDPPPSVTNVGLLVFHNRVLSTQFIGLYQVMLVSNSGLSTGQTKA